MKIIYLDHNIAHYFVRGFNGASVEADERRVCEECVARAPARRFALSFWNALEAARESANRGADTVALAERYANFWTALRPLHGGSGAI